MESPPVTGFRGGAFDKKVKGFDFFGQTFDFLIWRKATLKLILKKTLNFLQTGDSLPQAGRLVHTGSFKSTARCNSLFDFGRMQPL
jgi:hypothetical protein